MSTRIEIGRRRRDQAPPPHIVFAALSDPDRDSTRPWLDLEDDELRPRILTADPPSRLVWSSLWIKRPDAVIEFDLQPDRLGAGCSLTWTLTVEEPQPDDALIGHFRFRMNRLINGNLRDTFDA